MAAERLVLRGRMQVGELLLLIALVAALLYIHWNLATGELTYNSGLELRLNIIWWRQNGN